jgi:hypothetical protein
MGFEVRTIVVGLLMSVLMPTSTWARSACDTVLTCAPDTTLVCKWRNELDAKVYISSKLRMAYITSEKFYGRHNKIEVLRHDQKVIQIFVGNDPSSGAPRYLILDPQSDEVTRNWPADPSRIPCQRLPGRHLED